MRHLFHTDGEVFRRVTGLGASSVTPNYPQLPPIQRVDSLARGHHLGGKGEFCFTLLVSLEPPYW